MTNGSMLADILTPTDAAALLGVTRDHICLLIRRGDIKEKWGAIMMQAPQCDRHPIAVLKLCKNVPCDSSIEVILRLGK